MQKYVNRVDLFKSFPTSISFQHSALVQPRTSLSKREGDSINLFIRLLSPQLPPGERRETLLSGQHGAFSDALTQMFTSQLSFLVHKCEQQSFYQVSTKKRATSSN